MVARKLNPEKGEKNKVTKDNSLNETLFRTLAPNEDNGATYLKRVLPSPKATKSKSFCAKSSRVSFGFPLLPFRLTCNF